MFASSGVITLQAPLKIQSPSQPWDTLLMSYGLLSVLMVLHRLERDEFYETCAEIMKAIEAESEAKQINLPKRLSELTDIVDNYKGTWEKERYIAYSNNILYELGYIPRFDGGD